MTTESGKRTTVVIACTTMETVMVSDPAVFYEADVLHLIYLRGETELAPYYDSLVEEIRRQLAGRREVEVVVHDEKVYRYNVMLKTVNDIVRSVRNDYEGFADIYVNISSGTSEYAAAAMCSCMMNPGTIPFTVSVKEHSIPPEEYSRLVSADGRPVGDAKAVNSPKMVETFSFEPPDENLVNYLSFFSKIEDTPCSMGYIIALLEENDVWHYSPTKTQNPGRSAAKMQYRRTVLDPLLAKGWIRQGRTKNRWVLTPSGRAILDVFCDDDDDRDFRTVLRDISRARFMMCKSVRCMEPELNECMEYLDFDDGDLEDLEDEGPVSDE